MCAAAELLLFLRSDRLLKADRARLVANLGEGTRTWTRLPGQSLRRNMCRCLPLKITIFKYLHAYGPNFRSGKALPTTNTSNRRPVLASWYEPVAPSTRPVPVDGDTGSVSVDAPSVSVQYRRRPANWLEFDLEQLFCGLFWRRWVAPRLYRTLPPCVLPTRFVYSLRGRCLISDADSRNIYLGR